MKWDRPFKTIDEQIEIIRNKNIIIEPNSENKARAILSLIPYHTIINGYKDIYEVKPDYFKNGTTLEILYKTHLIYSNFNTILLKYFLHIEKSLKSSLGYTIAKHYGVYTDQNPTFHNGGPSLTVSRDQNDYLSMHHYDRINIFKSLAPILKLIKVPYDDTLIMHYKRTKNHIPPWIVANDLSFGKTLNWYNACKKPIKEEIIKSFLNSNLKILNESEKKDYFFHAMKQLVEYRDRVAHANKTCRFKLKTEFKNYFFNKILEPNSMTTIEKFYRGIGKNDVLAVILNTFILLNDDYLIYSLYSDLFFLIKNNENSYAEMTIYEVLGLPENFIDLLENFLIKELNFDRGKLHEWIN